MDHDARSPLSSQRKSARSRLAPRAREGSVVRRPTSIAALSLVALVLVTSTFLNYANAYTGWIWSNPLPQGNPLVSIAIVDASTMVAVGELGTIVRTTDGGHRWTQISSGTTRNLRGVSFAGPNAGTAVGASGTILRSTDAGATWTAQVSGTTWDLNGVSFTDANTGTAVGSAGTILRTTNGGAAWSAQASGTTQNLNGVVFTD